MSRVRHFKYYADDTMRPRADHESGEMVNRKPVVFSFMNKRPRNTQGPKSAGSRMGRLFVEKLKREGQP